MTLATAITLLIRIVTLFIEISTIGFAIGINSVLISRGSLSSIGVDDSIVSWITIWVQFLMIIILITIITDTVIIILPL